MTSKSSYAQIVKSSSIMGGAAFIVLFLGMVRTKFVAVLVGTTGIGLISGFTVMQNLLGAIAGLGVHSSAVRELANAVGKDDKQAVSRIVITLRRICLTNGLVGMAVMIILSSWFSQLTFNSDAYIVDIAALGLSILLINMAGGELALLQGMRRIEDMARANILGAVFSTVSSIGLYLWLDLRGIIPSLLSISAIQLVLAWYYARRIPITFIKLSWRQTVAEANRMIKLGLVFMATGLMGTAVSYLTVIFITQHINLQAVGIYGAAFALSGVFVNFVLGAMAADYYPRLTSVSHSHEQVNQLVNEQIEIGLLLATPGLLATMILAPFIVQVFYSSEFLPAAELLQWFILGCLGRVISWPLGYVMLALGKSAWLFSSELVMHCFHMVMIAIGLLFFELKGVSIAFFVLYLVHIPVAYFIAKRLTNFKWSASTIKVAIPCVAVFPIMLVSAYFLPETSMLFMGGGVLVVTFVFSIKELVARLGEENKISILIKKILAFDLKK